MITSLPPSDIILTQWNIIELINSGQQHVVGFGMLEWLGRVSTPILHFDEELRIAETLSGSRYTLRGESGRIHSDAKYVLDHVYPMNVIAYRFIYSIE